MLMRERLRVSKPCATFGWHACCTVQVRRQLHKATTDAEAQRCQLDEELKEVSVPGPSGLLAAFVVLTAHLIAGSAGWCLAAVTPSVLFTA